MKGIHNVKVGATFQHTLLSEKFSLGLTDPTLNDTCLSPGSNLDGSDGPTGDRNVNDPSGCTGGLLPNNGTDSNAGATVVPFNPLLGCIDLSRPNATCIGTTRGLFRFHGHEDVKEAGLFAQDTITAGNWSFNLGVRGDIYRGLSSNSQAEPRVGIAYNIKRTNSVLRVSYARVMETPFNENLVLGSSAGNPVISAFFGQTSAAVIPAGQRNEFHAGFQQAFGKFLVVDADYLWKYTHNAYNFSDFLNTPIFSPIAWHNSKINGFSVRASVPDFHGLTAFVVLSGVSARFFDPQVGGLGSAPPVGVFRIDHDQKFQQTTHVQYQPRKIWPWIGFNWRYDNGLVAGRVPCFNLAPNSVCNGTSLLIGGIPTVNLTGLSGDQQMQAGLFCGSAFPTLAVPLTSCAASQYGSTRIKIAASGTENDDTNPQRVTPRNLFDVSVGADNLFHKDHYRWSLRLTVINLTNKVALYNFLSTFSGTHFTTPRTYTGELGFHF